jgi:bacillithiol system protein YtxJ
MGFIKNLFSSSEPTDFSKNKPDWVILTSVSQLEELKEISRSKTVLIFKHSTRCGTSSMALKDFEKNFQPNENTVIYFLDLLRHRDVSDVIAVQFRVQHQSPQLLVIENAVCIKHASHYQINELL